MTKIGKNGRKVNVTDGKPGFQEEKRDEVTGVVKPGDHHGLRVPAQPTRLGKSVLRNLLPTRADQNPITVFEYEGQQFWTNRNMMLDVETIAPYVGEFKAPTGGAVSARCTKGSLVGVADDWRSFTPRDPSIGLMERTEDTIASSYPDRFDVTNPDLIRLLPSGDPNVASRYEMTVDDGSGEPRKVHVRADFLHMALGIDDLSTVSPDVTIEQAPLGFVGRSGRYTPLVITRAGRRVGLVMPLKSRAGQGS